MHLCHNTGFAVGFEVQLFGHVIERFLKRHPGIGGMRGLDGHGHGENFAVILQFLLRLHGDVGGPFQKGGHPIVHEINVALGKHGERVPTVDHRGDRVFHRTSITAITVHRKGLHALHQPTLRPAAQKDIVCRHENRPHAHLPTGFNHDHRVAMRRVIGQ